MFISYLYINLIRSRDGAFVRSTVRAVVWSSGAHDSFSSLWAAFTLWANQRIVNIMKLFIESNNIQVELIQHQPVR